MFYFERINRLIQQIWNGNDWVEKLKEMSLYSTLNKWTFIKIIDLRVISAKYLILFDSNVIYQNWLKFLEFEWNCWFDSCLWQRSIPFEISDENGAFLFTIKNGIDKWMIGLEFWVRRAIHCASSHYETFNYEKKK